MQNYRYILVVPIDQVSPDYQLLLTDLQSFDSMHDAFRDTT